MKLKKYWLIWGLLFSIPVMAEDLKLNFSDSLSDFSQENSQLVLETAQPVESVAMKTTYTWDDFLMGKSCNEDFHLLETLPFLSQDQQLLKDKMRFYCIGEKRNLVWSDLLNTFRQNKKNLLINKILKENGTVLGYVKAIPYFLLDIHNTSPKGNTLNDKLDLIQNAIQNKEPGRVLVEMQKLSAEDQLYLSTVFNEAGALIDFQTALQGGRND